MSEEQIDHISPPHEDEQVDDLDEFTSWSVTDDYDPEPDYDREPDDSRGEHAWDL